MTQINIQTRNGETRQLSGTNGQTLMELIQQEGIDGIPAECGGSCSCATCHVYVVEQYSDRLRAIREPELSMLEFAEHCKSNSRLSCQITINDSLDGAEFVVPPE